MHLTEKSRASVNVTLNAEVLIVGLCIQVGDNTTPRRKDISNGLKGAVLAVLVPGMG